MNFWYDQLGRDRRARFRPKAAFETYRNLLDGSGVDPYREPMFDRVWAAAEPKRNDTIFGLQFGGITVEGALHWQAHPWREAVGILLAELSDRLLEQVERTRDPWYDFVAFAERFNRDLDTGDGFELSDWQRRFAESVERGDVDVTIAAGQRARKAWTAEVMKAFQESRGTPEAKPPPLSLGGLQEMIGSVQSSDPKPVDYMVLDPAVAPGTHIEGRDGLGKRYVRVHEAALSGMPVSTTGRGGPLGTLWGIEVYRREDLSKGWPHPLP